MDLEEREEEPEEDEEEEEEGNDVNVGGRGVSNSKFSSFETSTISNVLFAFGDEGVGSGNASHSSSSSSSPKPSSSPHSKSLSNAAIVFDFLLPSSEGILVAPTRFAACPATSSSVFFILTTANTTMITSIPLPNILCMLSVASLHATPIASAFETH